MIFVDYALVEPSASPNPWSILTQSKKYVNRRKSPVVRIIYFGVLSNERLFKIIRINANTMFLYEGNPPVGTVFIDLPPHAGFDLG